MTGDRSAADDDPLRGCLDQLWGWAKAGKVTGRVGELYYLMDVENVDTFTRDVLRLFDQYAAAQVAAERERIAAAIEAADTRPVLIQAYSAGLQLAARIARGQP